MVLCVLFSLWCAMVLGVAYLLVAHFHSTITLHILHFLHRLGWDKSRQHLWDMCPEFEPPTIEAEDGTPHSMDWKDWFVLAFDDCWWHRMLADLITCPICISFHFSLWLSIAGVTLAFFALHLSPWAFLLIPMFTLSAPTAALFVYSHVNKSL